MVAFLRVMLVGFLLCPQCPVAVQAQMQLRKCFTEVEKPLQPFQLDKLMVQMDSWDTSQLVTVAAAIILSEHLGFNVEFTSSITAKDLYGAMAKGECHLAFEAWFVNF